MNNFIIKQPINSHPNEIESLSIQIVRQTAENYPKYKDFSEDEKSIINRMIHATTCFDFIINNIIFTKNATDTLKKFLYSGALIITDTNMIKSGINKSFSAKFDNELICKVADPIFEEISVKESITKSKAFIRHVLTENNSKKMILCCGNAPTFIFSAIETIIETSIPPENIFLIAMPVGFVNVLESKDYALKFLEHYNTDGIIINSNYGGSTLVVSAINAVYKLL